MLSKKKIKLNALHKQDVRDTGSWEALETLEPTDQRGHEFPEFSLTSSILEMPLRNANGHRPNKVPREAGLLSLAE